MPLVASISPADVAVAILLAIPLGLAALALLTVATALVTLGGCAAANWALHRANQAVLGDDADL